MQVESGLARSFEGTGLGLAMVKLLVELHGGTVFAASALSEGSRFTVWLPIRASDDGLTSTSGSESSAIVATPRAAA
jgi:signal transduction histidine kinase